MKDFAIIRKATDSFHTLERAESAAQLDSLYPSVTFDVVDMTGKIEPPWKEGITRDDINIVGGAWNIKLTDAEITTRTNARRATVIRRSLVTFKVEREMAVTLGPDYANMALEFQARIDALEDELAGLLC